MSDPFERETKTTTPQASTRAGKSAKTPTGRGMSVERHDQAVAVDGQWGVEAQERALRPGNQPTFEQQEAARAAEVDSGQDDVALLVVRRLMDCVDNFNGAVAFAGASSDNLFTDRAALDATEAAVEQGIRDDAKAKELTAPAILDVIASLLSIASAVRSAAGLLIQATSASAKPLGSEGALRLASGTAGSANSAVKLGAKGTSGSNATLAAISALRNQAKTQNSLLVSNREDTVVRDLSSVQSALNGALTEAEGLAAFSPRIRSPETKTIIQSSLSKADLTLQLGQVRLKAIEARLKVAQKKGLATLRPGTDTRTLVDTLMAHNTALASGTVPLRLGLVHTKVILLDRQRLEPIQEGSSTETEVMLVSTQAAELKMVIKGRQLVRIDDAHWGIRLVESERTTVEGLVAQTHLERDDVVELRSGPYRKRIPTNEWEEPSARGRWLQAIDDWRDSPLPSLRHPGPEMRAR